MKIARSILSTTALGLIVGLASPAFADDWETTLGADLSYNTRSNERLDFRTAAPRLHAYVPLNDTFAVAGEWGLTIADYSNGPDTSFNSLNPFLAAYLTPDAGPLRLRIGLGVALPVAGRGETGTEREAREVSYRTAMDMNGAFNPWLYQVDTLSLVVPGRLEFNISENFYAAVDAAVFTHLRTESGDDNEIGVQVAAEGRVPLGFINLGARLQGVRYKADVFQTSLEPFVGLNLGALGLRTKLTINLNDERVGIPSSTDLWGLHLGAWVNF